MLKNVFKNEKKTVLLAQEVNSNKIDVCCPQKNKFKEWVDINIWVKTLIILERVNIIAMAFLSIVNKRIIYIDSGRTTTVCIPNNDSIIYRKSSYLWDR